MTENLYERINRVLTWKKVAAFNVGILLILMIPLSINLSQSSTESRTGAAGEIDTPVVTPPPNYPSGEVRLDRVTMFFGKKGDTIVLLGNNFGDYQWGSKVYVGNVEAQKESIVRWSNSVIEVKIPDSARSGKVWVAVNGKESTWQGNLLLYEAARSSKIALRKNNSSSARITVSGASNAETMLVELGYVSEPVNITPASGIEIVSQQLGADALGKKLAVEIRMSNLNSEENDILAIDHPGIGAIELVRAELRDNAGSLLPIYADPMNMKVLP